MGGVGGVVSQKRIMLQTLYSLKGSTEIVFKTAPMSS